MTKHIDESLFAFIHVRPGEHGKSHPIGTIAVELVPYETKGDAACYRVGLARNASKEAWDTARGREVAAGRASRSKEPLTVSTTRLVSRRELIHRAVLGVLGAAYDGRVLVSDKFRRALVDTANRLQRAEAASRDAAAAQ